MYVAMCVDQAHLQEGLVEPFEDSHLPKHILVARALTSFGPEQDATVPVMNTSPFLTTLIRFQKI